MDAYLGQNPSTVEYSYFNGGVLNESDRAKLDRILEYHSKHDLYPVFLLEDKNAAPLVAEATIGLSRWTRDGMPMQGLKDMHNSAIDTPIFKAKGKRK